MLRFVPQGQLKNGLFRGTRHLRLKIVCFFFLLSFSFFLPITLAQNTDTEVEAAIQTTLEQNFTAANEEDVVGYLLTVHFDSSVYVVTQDALEPQFRRYDLSFELLELRLLSIDGDYAVARGTQKVTKLGESDFEDNITEALYIFRQELGVWKLWQQSPLEVEFLD